MDRVIQDHCQLWNLEPWGPQFETATSVLKPVKIGRDAALIKAFKPDSDERNTTGIIRWFDGHGSVKLLRSDRGAQLLEWIDGPHLSDLVRDGNDTLATEILTGVVGKLHAQRADVPPGLVSLERLMEPLLARRDSSDDIQGIASRQAAGLLETTQTRQPLHGDIHHDNILLHQERGWLAIDPKGLLGDRHYDLANALCNPRQYPEIVRDPARALLQARNLATRLALDLQRLLSFAFCYACLSAIWCEQDGEEPTHSQRMAGIFLSIRQSN